MKKKLLAVMCILIIGRVATQLQSQNSTGKAQCCATSAAALSLSPSHATTEMVDVTNGYTETIDVRTALGHVTLTPGETKKIARPRNSGKNDCMFELYFQRSGQGEIRKNCMYGITFQAE